MRRKKRSQVTLIMAIAVAIIVVFSIFYFVARSSTKSKLDTKVAGELTKDVQPVKEFVNQCLSKTAKEGLMLIGRQGGVIFRSDLDKNFEQGGLTDYDGVLGSRYLKSKTEYTLEDGLKTDIVWYGLKAITYDYGSPGNVNFRNFWQAPDYPWRLFPQSGEGSHYFGTYNYPPLRAEDESILGIGSNSIERQLERFITIKIGDCLKDISEFAKKGLLITMGEKNTDVTIGENEVRINFNMPLEIEDESGKGKAEFLDFADLKNVRLGMIYGRAREYIDNDISNIMYEPPDFDDGNIIRVNVLRDEFLLDDVVRIIDDSSRIDGEPYIFQYGRKNRRPALYFIDYTELDGKTSPAHTPTTKEDVLENAADNPDPFKKCLDPVNGKNCCKPYQDSPAIKNLIAIDPDCDSPIFKILDFDRKTDLPQPLPAGSRVIMEVWDGDESDPSLKDATGNTVALRDYHIITLN